MSIRRMVAVARYGLALSPMVEVGRLVRPHPFSADLLRADGMSRQHLEAARDLMVGVVGQSVLVEDRRWLMVLRLLLNEDEAAIVLLKEILGREPGDALAVGWAMLRRLEFDRGAARGALRAALEAGTLPPNDVHALLWLLVDAMSEAEVADYLARLVDAAGPDVGAELKSAIQALRGETPDDGEDAGLVLLADLPASDAADDDWLALEARLADLFGSDPPAPAALLYSGLVADRRRWSALEPYLEKLAAFATPMGVTLAVHGAHFTRPPADVLRFLEAPGRFFPGGVPPAALRHLQALAMRASGDVPGALDCAEKLAVETQAREDRLNLVQLQLSAGLVTAALPWIRRAFDDGQLRGADAVRFAAAVRGQDRDFARMLWRAGIELGVPDHLVVHAFMLAFALGLDREAGALSARVRQRALANAGDVFIVENVEDVVDHLLRRRENSARVWGFVEAGAVPIHLGLGALDSLARIFRLDRHAPDAPLTPLYIRHGGRPTTFRPDAGWKDWKVLLDITGLLIADQLDLLRFLEGLDEPVRISPRLIDALYQLRDQAVSNQLSYTEAARAILAALDGRALRTVEAGEIPEDAIVRHRADGDDGLTLDVVVETLQRLEAASADVDDGPFAIAPNTRLVFADGVLSDLAVAGLLEAALRHFQCRILADDAVALRVGVRQSEDQAELAQRFDRLRERVARGLQRGTYVTVQGGGPDVEDDDGDDALGDTEDASAQPKFDVFSGGLVDLLRAGHLEHGVVWADDRNLSSYTNAEGNVIVGVLEVLNALHGAGLLTDAERRERLITLRAGGALFIPMDPPDVVAALRAAPVREGRLVETPELAILRRNFALGIVCDRHLKVGDSELEQLNGRPDEVEYLMAMRSLAEACLVAIWCEPKSTLPQRRARSTWLWTNLRMNYGLRSGAVSGPDDGAMGMSALLLAGSLANVSAVLVAGVDQTIARQREYLAWLGDTVVGPAAEDGPFLDLVAVQFRSLILVDRDRRAPKDAEAVAQIRQLQTEMLPRPIQDRVLADPSYAAFVGVEMRPVQTIARATFLHGPFWRAVTRALRTGRSTTRTHDGGRVTFVAQDGALVCSGAFKATLRESMFEVLRQPAEGRRDAALAWVEHLDLDPVATATFRAAVTRARSDAEFAKALSSAEDGSVIQHYNRLARAVRQSGTTTRSFGPPPVRALLHHLRLSGETEGSIADRARAAWPELKAKIGAPFAFRRLAALPVDLGAVLAGDPDVPALMDALAKAPSPVIRLHLARCARLLGRTDEALRHIGDFMGATETEGELFCALLSWTEIAFHSDPDWPGLTAAHRLAAVWAHAERLLAALLDAEPERWDALRTFFENSPFPRSVGQALTVDPAYARDCAAPEHLAARGLLFHGLAYVFPGEDALDAVAAADRDRLTALVVAQDGQQRVPDLAILVRAASLSNATGSFLDQAPNLFAADLEPTTVRRAILEGVLAAVEANPADDLSWAVMAAFAKTGFDADLVERIDRLLESTPVAVLANSERSVKLCEVIVSARRAQASDFPDERLWSLVSDIGAILAERHPTQGAVQTTEGQADLAQAVELLGACAAASTAPEVLQRLQHGAVILGRAWPAAASELAGTLDNVARRAGARFAPILWRGITTLQTFS